MMETLFKTIHGSRLYGLAHAGSDEDYYTVLANRPKRRSRYAKQTIIGDIDSMVVDLSTFTRYADLGVPQALEAMFSEDAEIDLIEDFRLSYRANLANARDKYTRTIKSFALGGDFKRKRHALRLAKNLTELMGTGRFNPRLSETAAKAFTLTAGLEDDVYFMLLKGMMPCEGLSTERD